MADGRTPIKIGTGYIEIVPKVPAKDMAELRKQVQAEMRKLGLTAGKEINEGVAQGLAGLPAEAKKRAKQAKVAVEAEAKDSAETVAELERWVTQQYGAQARKRLTELRAFYERYEGMTEEASRTTQQALRETVRQEQRAAQDRIQAERQRAREVQRLVDQERRDHDRNQREMTAETRRQQAAQTAAVRQASRERIAAMRAEALNQRNLIQQDIAGQQQILTQTRARMRELQGQMSSTTRTTQNFFSRTEASLKKTGTYFDQVGTSITEAGNILTTKFLGPLAAVGGLLTATGVKSADSLKLGQLGLMGTGASAQASADVLKQIRQYGVDTPYSVEDMQMYLTRYIRALASHDKRFKDKNPGARQGAANDAALKASEIVRMIGDNSARAGNLDPNMVSRAMYAIDMMLDTSRLNTRNLRQFANAAGMSVQELALMMGFKDKDGKEASAYMLEKMAKSKETGGVSSNEFVNNLLSDWKGADGSQGRAAQVTSETITGRIQQLREGAQVKLGEMFARTNPETGRVEYTDLGNRIAGKGGFLDDAQDIATKYNLKENVPKFLGLFFDAIESFTEQIMKIVDYIREHDEIKQLFVSVAKFLVEWGPLILAVGLLSKVLGKAVGLVGRLLTPVGAAVRGTVNGVRGGRDVVNQARARSEARRDARERGESRSSVRQAGRDAYRQTRADRNGGEGRSMGRRMVDAALGRSGPTGGQREEMEGLERQARETQQEIDNLGQRLREVNSSSMRDIQQALGGGSQSVQGGARQAQQAVNSVQQQAQQLNRTSLGQARQELTEVEEAARKAATELGNADTKARNLNGQTLNAVKGEVDALKSAAELAGKEVTSINSRVGNLNGKDVNQVRGSVESLTSSARDAAQQIGDGAMSASVSGRIANTNKRRLTDIIAEFNKLHTAANDVFEKVGQGTGATSLAGRIGLLNNRSLKDVKDHVEDLGKSLDKAKGHAEGLDASLGEIGKKAPGGGGGGGKKKNNARGGIATQADVSMYGVMPGYAPWTDNIPAVLSPGEAVLRPEVTNALGSDTINTWNALAIRGRLSRHARGTSGGGGKLNLDAIRNLIDLQGIAPVGTAMLKTMKMDGSSDSLGGSVQGGILSTGDRSSALGGNVAADQFRGMYDWMTDEVFELLRKVPTLVGQAAGILGGVLGPVQADYFWGDVWKGDGNIVDRGKKYMSHLFSMETLGKVWDNLYSGVGDSLGAIWDLVSDPVGAFTDAFGDIGGILSGSYNNIIDMVETVREIKDAPMEYASRVFGEFMENTEESMPNTKGLFDFKGGSRVDASIPDFGAGLPPKAGAGGAGQWAPTALQAMSMLGIPSSALQTVLYRIGMESGGDPMIVNKWDSNWLAGTPSVGLMQVIGPTFDAYAGPFRNSQPKLYGTSVNPLANIYAGLSYATKRYGSGWQRMLAGNTGYATGTISASPGFAMVGEKGRELVSFGGGERVYNNAETESLLGKKYEIHVHEAKSEPTPQAVMRALQTAEALYTTF